MLNTEKRIAALEASALDDTMKIIIVESNEAKAEALERIGLSPHAPRVVCISALDARL